MSVRPSFPKRLYFVARNDDIYSPMKAADNTVNPFLHELFHDFSVKVYSTGYCSKMVEYENISCSCCSCSSLPPPLRPSPCFTSAQTVQHKLPSVSIRSPIYRLLVRIFALVARTTPFALCFIQFSTIPMLDSGTGAHLYSEV